MLKSKGKIVFADLHKQDNPTNTTPCADDELMLGRRLRRWQEQ